LLLDEETEAAAHELVIVGEQDTNFSHGGFMDGSGADPLGEAAVRL
jgi:hypothetical protein